MRFNLEVRNWFVRFDLWTAELMEYARCLVAVTAGKYPNRVFGVRCLWAFGGEGTLCWYIYCGSKTRGYALSGPIRRIT